MKKENICIICPKSCHIEVEYDQSNIVHIKGAGCKKGIEFAENEFINPMRVFTGSVVVKGGNFHLLSVKTSGAISKIYIRELGELTHKIVVQAPIKIGVKVLENVLDQKIDLIATRNVDKISWHYLFLVK